MKSCLLIFALSGLDFVSSQGGVGSRCTGDRATDVNRIEYQMKMDASNLRGNTLDQIDAFIDWLDETMEDGKFNGVLTIQKSRTERWLRRVREINCLTPGAMITESSIKYRQSIDGGLEGETKYQHDLAWGFRYGDGVTCQGVTPGVGYEHLFDDKVESNQFPEMCNPSWVDMFDPLGGMGYSAQMEFDKDPQWGVDDASLIPALSDENLAAWCSPNRCHLSGMNDFFPGHCSYLANANRYTIEENVDLLNLVVEVDFKLETDKDMDGDLETISDGKLTFQVRYDTMDDYLNDFPSARETELSVKLRRDHTDNGWWDWTCDRGMEIAAQIAGCGSPYLLYRSCNFEDVKLDDCFTKRPTMSPTQNPALSMCCVPREMARPRWGNICPIHLSRNECQETRRLSRNCQWVPC